MPLPKIKKFFMAIKLGILETYNTLVRYKEISTILMKFGYRDVVERLNLSERFNLKDVSGDKDILFPPDSTAPERFRALVEALGTTFIKFGQILSTRPDLLPPDYCEELKKLQDKVLPFPDEVARQIIESELGAPIEKLFKTFSEKPIAAASIAQVYKATLENGEKVAVKVRRPDIERVIASDLAIMRDLAKLLERHFDEVRTIRPLAMVEQFGRNLVNETNFLIEAYNLERFNAQNEDREELYLVKLHRDLSTSRVLTMEFMEGVKISDTDALKKLHINLTLLARDGTRVLLSQIFEQGFFHGDPHPGNILVQDDARLCFLDFGVMGKLTLPQRIALAEMLIAVARRDDEKLLKGVIELAENGEELKNTRDLGRDISEFVDKYAYISLERLKAEEILNDLLKLLTVHGIVLPPECYTLIKVIVTLEGTGRILDPHFQILEQIRPFAEKLILERYNPARLAKDMTKTSAELYRLLRDLPDELRQLFKVIKKGEVRLTFSSQNVKLLLRSFDKDVNRLSYSLIVAALLIASTILLHSHVPPVWHEVSLLGLFGLLVSGAMGLWLLFAIARSGHLL